MLHFPVLVFYIICSITYFHVTKHFPCVPGKHHSHKKRKDSLEGSLDRVLFAAELEFPKILVPRLSQHTSNVNIECAGKSEWSKQLYSLCVTSFLEHWNTLILLFWYCLTTPVISLYHRCLTLEENILAVVTQDKVTDGNLKRQIKNQTLCTCRFRLD